MKDIKKVKPYDYCDECEHKKSGKCKVWDRSQRLPRPLGLGMCIKIAK